MSRRQRCGHEAHVAEAMRDQGSLVMLVGDACVRAPCHMRQDPCGRGMLMRTVSWARKGVVGVQTSLPHGSSQCYVVGMIRRRQRRQRRQLQNSRRTNIIV
jgi:hypothetical protein